MRTKTVLSIPVLVLALSALPSSAAGVTWWVDDDTCPGVGDGSQGNPFCLIQDAYDAAGDADEVRVMPGAYAECVAAADLVSQKGVSLVADAFDPQNPETSAALTTINGTGLCSFPDATVNLGGVGSRLEGFRITGGEASGVFGVGSVTITNNLIEGNSSTLGGGIYVYPGACVYGNTTTEVSNNIVRNNIVAYDAVAQYSGDGGGIYIFARADAGIGGCLQGSPTVTVENNTIDSNSSDFLGGGMVFFSLSADAFTSVTGTISQNTITGNHAGDPGNTYGDGGGLWGTTYGYGTETLTIQDNTVSGNDSTLSAGGISLRMDSLSEANHTIVVDNNDVINNSAEGDGGGLQLWMIATDVLPTSGMTFQATDNTITGNDAVGDNGGGGGLLAISESIRSNVTAADFTISGNTITGNQSDLAGGGVGLWVSADSENLDAGDGLFNQGIASINFDHNLVAGNTAGSATTTGFGGGIFTYLQSFGADQGDAQAPSTATANVTFNTIAFNENDGGSGGIEIENNTGIDGQGFEGLGVLLIDSSIIADNVNSVGGGYGIGGPPPGVQGFLQSTASSFNLQLDVNYSNVSGHTVDGNFQSDYPVLPAITTSQADALLDATTRRPMECSPTIDAANPFAAGVDASLEPAPNRGLPNQGHTGGTSLATVSLPDVNGDGVVDGIDVTRLAAAFGSSFGQGRYNAAADMDGNDVIDGTDLAFVATMGYGDVCP